MIPESRPFCVKCGRVVDPRGATDWYCQCVCRFPGEGCGARIYFLVNRNGKRQPFDLVDGKPHHATCPAWKALKESDRTCPSCNGARPKGRACNHCGWSPTGERPAKVVRDRGQGVLEAFR